MESKIIFRCANNNEITDVGRANCHYFEYFSIIEHANQCKGYHVSASLIYISLNGNSLALLRRC